MQITDRMTKEEKMEKLNSILRNAGSAVVAFSGGTDSVFLLYAASKISSLKLLAVTVVTPYMHALEIAEAKDFCNEKKINHTITDIGFPATVRNNPEERCYLCKKEVFAHISKIAAEGGYKYVFDGTNADDVNDYRPGMKALKEAGARSPLLEAGLTKAEIRELSKAEGLFSWDKPANACLMTRFPHGTMIETEELRKVEKAERFLSSVGLSGSRVRVHGDLVRIECRGNQFETVLTGDKKEKITGYLKALGYRYITIDLEGYITGRMNIKPE